MISILLVMLQYGLHCQVSVHGETHLHFAALVTARAGLLHIIAIAVTEVIDVVINCCFAFFFYI